MYVELEKQIAIAAVLVGYPREAVMFVLGCWTKYEVCSQTHIDGGTLCWRIHDQALRMFDKDARRTLGEWGISETADIGKIVMGLIEHGLVETDAIDDFSDFENVYNFSEEFEKPKFAADNRSYQWNLSLLFVVTTFCSVLISGYTRGGVGGMLPALFSSWFAILGLSFVIIGIKLRTAGWIFLLCFGVLLLGIGIFTFFSLAYL